MTRYRILQHRRIWSIQRFNPNTAQWDNLGREFDNASAELAGRAVDAMVAQEMNETKEQA